jgi:2-dehydro-3-deoxyglucarate aldolase/4-hydroxy-2-oxoheptanedioate aldolase
MKRGDILIGTLLTLGSPDVAEILSTEDFDWLFIDMEHAPLDVRAVQTIIQAVGKNAASLIRVPSNTEVWLKQVLDTGPAGVIIPQVGSRQDAENAVRWCHYPPLGSRSVGVGRAQGYGAGLQTYIDHANDEIAIIVQIEHIDAVGRVEEILSVPGVDAVLIGPYDLSASMGKPGKVDDSDVQKAIRTVNEACLRRHFPVGIFAASSEAAASYLKGGYSLIAVGTDTLFLGGAARETLRQLGRGNKG